MDLRTWRKGDGQGRGVAFDGIACPTDSSGQSPSRTRPVGIGTSLVSGCEASGEREGAQSSPVPPDSGALLPGRSASAIFSQAGLEEKKAETYLPLRKRRYAMQGADGDTQGPLVGKVPKTEHSDGDMDSWNSQCNGCCPSYISVTYPRLPAGYYPGKDSNQPPGLCFCPPSPSPAKAQLCPTGGENPIYLFFMAHFLPSKCRHALGLYQGARRSNFKRCIRFSDKELCLATPWG